ncbi:MAG: cysteine desulfurase family protein [Chloroflexota bacterium]|nr:cysteine desulfurase family protein [Chloroflexota bacterium]
MREAYLDNAATTRLHPEVLDAMLPYLKEVYGNPQSMHNWGDRAKEAVEASRVEVADLIGGNPEEIIFTSSGTEANNFAVKGIARANQSKGKHIIISAIEHFSVMNSAKTLQKGGFEVTEISVDKHGIVDLDEIRANLRDDTILVSIMHANGEVGTIQNIEEISRLVKEKGIVFHTDAVASAGTIPVDVKEMGVDVLSMASNQFYGPKGAGAIWVRKGIRIIPMLDGGVQEGGRRGGTEDVPAIVGMGKAAKLAKRDLPERMAHISNLRDRLIEGLPSKIKHVILTGHPQQRLPGNASFCIEFVEGESMLMMLSSKGVAVSSGSACTSKALKASHVLTAMNLPPEIAQGSILFSLGPENTIEDIDYVLEVMPPIVQRLREMSPLYDKFLKQQKGG